MTSSTHHSASHSNPSTSHSTASSGFIDTQIIGDLSLPTDMAFLPDGRMLVIEKGGTIRIVEDPTAPSIGGSPPIYMDLGNRVFNSAERGLLAIEVDPNFSTNGYFYLFYTKDLGLDEEGRPIARTTVSRFQHVENSGGTTSQGLRDTETVLWQERDRVSNGSHQGGGLAIAYEPSGDNDPSPYKIYITVGDEFAPANAANLEHDDGKVHRVNLTDGSIPTDNPFYEDATPHLGTSDSVNSQGQLQSIYSYGLRNPFRASYDQESQTLFVGEVGGNNPTSTEDIHIAAPGANHGWDATEMEGFFEDLTDPGSPLYSYSRQENPGLSQLPDFPGGASVTGGVVYRGNSFPDQFQGAYFYGDWVRKWIRYLELDYSGDRPVVKHDHLFKNATGQVLSFEEGPDGSLYYITTFQTGNVFTFEGAVNRLEPSGDNSAPVGTGIVLSPDELESPTANHTVTFEADVTDPDGDDEELSYRWSFGDGADLTGDGVGDTATSTEANPTYTYTEKGAYTVELVVTDSQGAATVFDSQQIIVGQRPEVTIATPLEGSLFRAGENLTLTGSAIDPEDGVLSGNSVTWSTIFLHNEHFHPGISGVPNQTGGINFEIPDVGHDYSSDTGYEIFLTATDSDGISTTESVIIRPEKVSMTFDAPVEYYSFSLDGLSRRGDFVYDNIINFRHTIEAQASYVDQGVEYNFSHWADDLTNTNPVREFVVPDQDVTFQPVYQQGGSVNDALALNGSRGVSIPNIVVGQDNGDFTVEAWVKFAPGDSISNTDGLISAGIFGNGNDLNFFDGRFRLYSSTGGDVVVANHQSQADVWTHYAIARENGVMKVYVDGQLDTAQSTTWTDSLNIEQIGAGILAGGLNGQLDELRIWSVARSQSDIDTNKDIRIESDTAGLERYYQFDGDIVDVTGNSDRISLPTSAQLIPSTAPVLGDLPRVDDFDRNGFSDIVWRNLSTGSNALWRMEGATVLSNEILDGIANQDWKLVGTGVFNNNGNAGILWRHSITGANAIWGMQGTTRLSSQFIASRGDLNWEIVGTGKFNGDGYTDILWRNQTTGENEVWYMNDGSITGTESLDGLSNSAWVVAGVGNFNQDGYDDILWRNTATGANAIWHMDANGTRLDSTFTAGLTNQDWQIIGVGKFNSDSYDDIVWRNNVTGNNAIWYMQDTTRLGVEFTSSLNTQWTGIA